MKRSIILLLVLFSLPVADATAKHHKTPRTSGHFDYFLLSLSWAPEYCATHQNDNSSECRSGNQTGFVLHGLWPQSNTGQAMNCAAASPVASDIVRRMRQYFPSVGLIQHEWTTHGTCSGLSASDYFAQVEQAFKSVQLPDQFSNQSKDQMIAVGDIESQFAATNHAPAEAFRVSCHNKELVGVEACLTKDLQFQACSSTGRECPVSPVLVRATK